VPPKADTEVTDPTREACPPASFYGPNILEWWKVNVGRFPNVARMARDIHALQGGSVGVERVFSIARDVILDRRSRLKRSTIRSAMLVQSYENEELRGELAGQDSKGKARKLEEMAAVEDYRYWADRKEQSIENDNGCISDENKSHNNYTEWSFVDQDGRPAFGREPKGILPENGLVESQYAQPGPPRNQSVNHLGGSEESDAEERIWDREVNRYIASETDEEEGSQEGKAEIPGEGLRNLESIDQQGDASSGSIARSSARPEEDRSEEDALSGTTDSLPVIHVTRGRDHTGTNTTIRVPPRKPTGTGGKEKKRSRFHRVDFR